MFSCDSCKKKFSRPTFLANHIERVCLTGRYKCSERSCGSNFSSRKTFITHMNRVHVHKTFTQSRVQNSFQNQSHFNDDLMPIDLNDGEEMDVDQNADDNEDLNSLIVDNCLKSFFSELYANPQVPRNMVQIVGFQLNNFISKYNNILKMLVEQENVEFHETLSAFSERIKTFSTEHRRISSYESAGTLILPKEIVIGCRMEYSQTKQIIQRNCTMQVVHLGAVMEKFLILPNILKDTSTYLNRLHHSSDPIENIVQGSVWRKMVLKFEQRRNLLHLPIILYFDDFETNNPLGSHNVIQKLGALYVSLPFLPPKYFSRLNSIFLLALFHSSDRVDFGNRLIFQKVIDELNELSTKGISICINNVHQLQIKFHVVAITGDNAGINSCLGFVESFIANFSCRICCSSRMEMQKMTRVNENSMRNMESYIHQANQNKPSETGIKEKCAFLKLEGFDLFENVAVDLLHDFLEGVCRYVMDFVVNYLVFDSKLVSTKTLELRLINFHYGPDKSAKPVNALVMNGARLRVRTSASEMLTLVRYFALIAGSFVPQGDDVWHLFLLLRRLLNILCTHRVYRENHISFIETISEFNKQYILIAKTHLKPKFHFLLHYPDMFKKFGPLTQVWTMRFESKHRIFKVAARASCNKMNICKTTAIRNQLTLNHMFLSDEPFKFFSCGRKSALKLIDMQSLVKADIITSSFIAKNFSVPFVVEDGINFHIGDVLLVDIAFEVEDMEFVKVDSIFVEDSTNVVSFLCTKFDCLGFDSHLYAHEVALTDTQVLIPKCNFFPPVVPHTFTKSSDLRNFITLRINIS